MEEAVKAITIKLKISKLQLIIILIAIILATIGYLLFRLDAFNKAYAAIFKANVELSVVDSETNKGLPASITLTNKDNNNYHSEITADQDGKISIANLVKGDYALTIKYSGYIDYASSLTLIKGSNNPAAFKLSKIPPKKVNVTGTIQDFVSETVLNDAAITLGDQIAKSDSSGKFNVNKVITGSYQVKVKKDGYLDYSKEIDVKEEKIDPISLVPQGKVVFVSNRDQGKRGIYVSNIDGSDSKPLVQRVGENEDYNPIVSTNNKKVIFLSTREGKKEKGNTITGLFIVDIDGKNLVKISDKASYGYFWSDNLKNVIWQTTVINDSGPSTFEAYVYNVANQSNTQVVSSKSSVSNLMINDSSTKLAYSLNDYSSGKYEIDLYNIGDNSTTKAVDAKSSVYLVKFKSDNEIIYSSWDQQSNQTKYYSLNLSDNSSQEVQYEFPKRTTVKAPSGKLVSYIEARDGKKNVFISNTDNSGEKKLTSIDTAEGQPYWSLDGNLIFFNNIKSGESALYVVSPLGGAAKKVTDISAEGYGYGMQ